MGRGAGRCQERGGTEDRDTGDDLPRRRLARREVRQGHADAGAILLYRAVRQLPAGRPDLGSRRKGRSRARQASVARPSDRRSSGRRPAGG